MRAQADALVYGTSRFASVAQLLCARCVASFNVQLDPRCRHATKRPLPHEADAHVAQAPPHATRCIGTGSRYTAVNEFHADGRGRTVPPFL